MTAFFQNLAESHKWILNIIVHVNQATEKSRQLDFTFIKELVSAELYKFYLL